MFGQLTAVSGLPLSLLEEVRELFLRRGHRDSPFTNLYSMKAVDRGRGTSVF